MTATRIDQRPRVFYGWWIVAATVIAMAVGSGITFFSFGLFINPIEEEFGWSRAEISLGFSVAYFWAGIAAPLIGRVVDLKGPRLIIGIGAIASCLTFLLLAQTTSLWQWYVFRSLNAIFFQMMFFIPFMSLVSRWFLVRRGLALTMVGIGFQLGGFVVVPIMQEVIDTYGWRGGLYFSSAITALVFIPITTLVLRNLPADVGARVDGRERHDQHTSVEPSGLGPAAVLRLPHFWASALAFAFLLYGFTGWTVHQVPFWESEGYSRGTAALLVALASGLSIAVRIAFGVIADKFQRYEIAGVVFSAMLGVAIFSITIEVSFLAVSVYMLFRVVGGSAMMLESLHLLRSYGSTHFGSILGIVVVFETVTEILSPWLAGLIFDKTGTYDIAMLMFAASFVAAAVMFAIAARLPRPLNSTET